MFRSQLREDEDTLGAVIMMPKVESRSRREIRRGWWLVGYRPDDSGLQLVVVIVPVSESTRTGR